MVIEIITVAGFVVTVYGIVDKKIGDWKKVQEENAKIAQQLIALHEEVRKNRETAAWLAKLDDKSSKAVYDPVVRKYIEAFRFDKLKKTSMAFDQVLGNKLKKEYKKEPSPKDPMRIFWNIKDVYRSLETLSESINKTPARYAANAPRILLVRRIPVLERRLKEIDEALKIVPVKKQGTKSKSKK